LDVILRIDINLLSILFALVLGLSLRSKGEKLFLDYRLFMMMLCAVVFELAADSAMWLFEGSASPPARRAFETVSLLYYLCHPLAPMFFLAYTVNQIWGDSRHMRSRLPIIALPAALSALLSLASLFTGWYFYVDGSGFYRHGPLFFLFACFSYAYFAAATVLILANWRRAERRTLAGLLIAPLLPTIASALQVLYYGLVLIWPAMVVSLLVLYVNIQQRKLMSDYLTGAFNRRRLDEYLGALVGDIIESSTQRPRSFPLAGKASPKGFAGFLADVDDFKSINDRFGHAAGDKALVETVRLLQASLRSEDFLARYAGDEFVVILPMSSGAELAQIVERVRARFAEYSPPGARYRLSLSIGAAVFDPELDSSADRFVERLDGLMYREKAAKKSPDGGTSAT
jgi:diguanylate cyclase (GGDEF)-like protein